MADDDRPLLHWPGMQFPGVRLTPDQVALALAIQRDSELTDAEFAAAATCMER